MTRTIILRFSDYEATTVPAHLEVIEAEGPVWWGWWKKEHEPMRTEILTDIANRCPIRIGLVNTEPEEFYSAECTRVVFDPRGSPRRSPEPGRTPAYYRDSAHPAWFEFASIEPTPRHLFVQEFGAVPENNPTLFPVEETVAGPSVLGAAPDLDLTLVDTPGESILHLSDLHFGDYHGFPTEEREEPIHERTLASVIADRFGSLTDGRIGVVVVSGDLITRGDANGYPFATAFLESLMSILGLGREHIFVVPGNHDIWLEDLEHPTRSFPQENPFRQFLGSFYGPEERQIERLLRFRTPEGWILSFAGLNSARPRKREYMEYGYVGAKRYQPLLRGIVQANSSTNVAELAREKSLNFAVLHHHLLPAALVCKPEVAKPVSLTLDAGQLVADLQGSGVHFALHGHQHIPFVGSTARARLVGDSWGGHEQPLYVIGSGSSGVMFERTWPEMRNNSFGIYTPQPDGLHIQVEEFNQSIAPRPHMQLVIRYGSP